MKSISTTIYIILISLVIAIPLFQTLSRVFPEPELGGYVNNMKVPELTYQSFVNNSYTLKLEKYIKGTYGLRAYFIRVYNQYMFSLFREVSPKLIFVGKDNHLFAKQYIDSHYGRNFVGKKKIDDKIGKLIAIQDTLKSIGKDILVVLAASKGTFHEEFIPDHMVGPDTITNYKYYRDRLIQEDVHHIDFNDYFLQIKGTRDYPLYAKHVFIGACTVG